MAKKEVKEPTRKPRGRPVTRTMRLDATPEEVAKAIFAAAKPPPGNKQREQDDRE